jgi:UDP-N-acetylmuramate dehydrogenase
MTDGRTIDDILSSLLGEELVRSEPLSRHTTLRVGGPASWYWPADDVDQLSKVLAACWFEGIPYLLIGHGSNLLMSDRGYRGLIIRNKCKQTSIPLSGSDSLVFSECGVSLGSLFSQTARAGYSGLEWAVGIPGTVGGALVSNAGAYRGNIGPLVRSVRVLADGLDQTVGPDWMEFSYRDSKLRRAGVGKTVVLSCVLELKHEGAPGEILLRAKHYQEQRKAKQPFYPSAGSFFKNVLSKDLAESLAGLPAALKEAGVVPAGYIIEAAGLKGLTVGGAQSSEKHANFLINTGSATASDFHILATAIKAQVNLKFGVTLEEEVLYVGDWD